MMSKLSSWWSSYDKWQKRTWIGIGISGVAWIVWDVFLATDGHRGDTISSVFSDQAWAAGILGFILGHMFISRRLRLDVPTWTAIPAGVISVSSAAIIPNEIATLGIGITMGALFWPNYGRKDGV